VIGFFVSRAGGNKVLEIHRVEPGKLPEIGAETARIKVVFTVDT
jgi:hypothetical protein